MAGVVNLRQAKKARQRLEKQAKADANATKFGRTKSQRQADTLNTSKARSRLDGHKRDPQ